MSESGDIIPANRDEFNENLSQMTELNGKYYGETNQGPVRVRVEATHQPTQEYAGPTDNDHLVDHIHIEYRANGETGAWGSNKTTVPQEWLK